MARYKLFIDESGVPELSAHSDFCILTGVLIEDSKEKGLEFIMNRIKKEYKLDLNKHIHAVEIFERKNSKCYLGKTLRRPTKDLRMGFQKETWDFIKYYGIKHYTVTVSKKLCKKALNLTKYHDGGELWISSSNFYARVDRQLPMDIGVNTIYDWALKQIKDTDDLEVVFESRSGDQFTVRNYGYVQDKDVFKGKRMRLFCQKLKDRAVCLAFANKGVGLCGLELADLISYTSNKKKINNVDSLLKKSVCFNGIHKTLNNKHYIELNERATKKYFPGISSRTKRIAKWYTKKKKLANSLSPAIAGAQLP